MDLSNKIKPKIQKVINRFPTEAFIYREGTDKYGQPTGEVLVCEIRGFYHEESSKANLNIVLSEAGKTYKGLPGCYLMILVNEESKGLQKGDILYFKDTQGNREKQSYVIEDLGDLNRMGIYFDLNLRRT